MTNEDLEMFCDALHCLYKHIHYGNCFFSPKGGEGCTYGYSEDDVKSKYEKLKQLYETIGEK
jgi:hypothetical protein